MTLSLLCITLGEPYSYPFLRGMIVLSKALNCEFALIADGGKSESLLQLNGFSPTGVVYGEGPSLEPVLDEALSLCHGDYVLRLDDDERCSVEMIRWLAMFGYEESDHWSFPRRHMWPDADHFIVEDRLYPDYQTRLSVRAKAGGRHVLHAGSPFGPGMIASVSIEHFKFLVRSYAQRLELARRYDSFHNGLGTGAMLPFNLPEDAYEEVSVRPVGTKETFRLPIQVTR